jgi:hypothetical protein
MPFLKEGDDPKHVAIQFAKDREEELNKFYDVMAKRLMFCEKHRLVIKGEAVNSTAFWVAKKRYALNVYNNERVQNILLLAPSHLLYLYNFL